MNKDIEYNIGLDIGVGSVGWCVTDEENNLLKIRGKNMWGSRLFSEAQTAAKRRNFRSTRRRLERRKNRIAYLQDVFKEEMDKEYPNFFPMLKETANVQEDKTLSNSINGKKHNLFSDIINSMEIYTDIQYYKKFPTIYHLRNFLVNSKEKQDIRLVYLAMHHIIKYRGNFLYDSDFSNDTSKIEDEISTILNYLKEKFDLEIQVDEEELLKILQDKKISKADKKDKLIKSFDYNSSTKTIVTNTIKAILGYSFDITKIFDVQLEKNSNISFSKEIENEEQIESELKENADIYNSLKATYSWFTLQDILKGKTYISEAFMEKYDKYGKDLKELKKIYKKYYPDEYNDFFRKENLNNYVHYNGKQIRTLDKAFKEVEFFSTIKNKIKKLPDEYENKQKILDELESDAFLRKLRITDNGAIPHQLHQKELEKIIDNQAQYYPFLQENRDKILKIFYVKIPYYVGPLIKNKEQSEFAWLLRKGDEDSIKNDHIRPWNMSEVINIDKTAEQFINRLTNNCTYLLTKPVIPKNSILYSKYCVLNELNNITYATDEFAKDRKHFATDTKKKIIDELFKKKSKVNRKMLIKLLDKEGISNAQIFGLADGENFNSNMKSYRDMQNIFGVVDESNIEMCEQIIYYITIFEDKSILKRRIKKEFGNKVTDEQLNKLLKLKYAGWSRISKELLIGIKNFDGDTIMDKLEKTSMNFMQIINENKFSFKKEIEKCMPEKGKKITYKDVEEIPTSPTNKRAIWQSICVVNEIEKIMKHSPKSIYIEFARSEDQNKKMKDSRAKQLLKKYNEIEKQVDELKNYDTKVYKQLKKHQDDKELTDRLYLYFIQNGKSLYSQKPLNIDELDKYEVDHIIPQSYKKDDSFDNKALVLKEENQRKKDSLLLEDKIIDNNTSWWKSLYDHGLISSKKYSNLIKRTMLATDEQANKFVQRQLVETRQITKYVANLLKNSNEDISVFAIRAELTHSFRLKYNLYKNRNVNDCHHAQDAYILSTIGNILNKEWHGLEKFEYGKYFKDYLKEGKNKNEKYGILGFINKRVDVPKVEKVMQYKDYFITRLLEEGTGEFYNQTIQKAGKASITLKNDKKSEMYGGYTGEQKAYCVIYSYIDKKGKIQYTLTGIPIKIACDIKLGKTNIEEFIKGRDLQDKEYTDFKILKNKILINQEYLDENNEPMRLCSDSEIRPDKQLIADKTISKLVYIMNSDDRYLTDNDLEELHNSYTKLYDYLLDKLNNEYKIFKEIYVKLLNQREQFEKLDYEKKKSVINGLINLMATGQGNLKELGLGERAGRRSGIKFNTNRLKNMIFINKSVTGMYESRYKIDGLENYSSK